MKVLESFKVPIKIWADEIEEGAMEQANNLTDLPFIHSHVALMPDVHQGYGMPIGGVIATKGVVIPNAVGVDIGCGMLAVKTSLNGLSTHQITTILENIKRKIPTGYHHRYPKNHTMHDFPVPEYSLPVMNQEEDKLAGQMGTLGGGNHFIELQLGDDGHVWFMIHSGSRNFGKKVCDYYNNKAKVLNKIWHSSVDPKHDLAFLPIHTDEGQDYIVEMNYAVRFAAANREIIANDVMDIVKRHTMADEEWRYDIPHNYARMESHFGKNVMVHRKGAISAKFGEHGIIPGSQGTSSFITRGKGNIHSFESCSHGAGRTMGRKEAKRSLDLEEQIKLMGSIVHGMDSRDRLDEAPGAYKDIQKVMAESEDLVQILTELFPIGVVKG